MINVTNAMISSVIYLPMNKDIIDWLITYGLPECEVDSADLNVPFKNFGVYWYLLYD